MRPPRRDLTGQRYGSWLVLGFAKRERYAYGTTANYWLCACDCGHEAMVRQSNLLTGASSGCKWCGHPAEHRAFIDSMRHVIAKGYKLP